VNHATVNMCKNLGSDSGVARDSKSFRIWLIIGRGVAYVSKGLYCT